MDQAKFQEAQALYDEGDYRGAAKAFLASAGRGSVGNGAAFHMGGNSLMRLRRYADAVTVYGHALRDEMYDRRAAVFANLGAAYVALGELSEAVGAYESALGETGYATPYRAWQGIAAAQMDRGRAEEAAFAYRKAALDPANPDPGKALVNLGLCFMALDRVDDAIEAYQAALGFDDYAGRGKALANLGQAYVAKGQFGEAVRAFEKATQLHGHKLTPAAQSAYDAAVAAARPAHEVVDGWETGELPPQVPAVSESQGWDTSELAALAAVEQPEPEEPAVSDDFERAGSHAAEALGFGDDEAVSSFFSRTEDDMKAYAREARRAERSQGRHPALRGIIAGACIAAVLVAAVAGAYFAGLGWPTQATTVKGLLGAYQQGDAVDEYWVAVPNTDVAREMAKVPPVKEFSIDSVDRGKDSSSVGVTVTPKKGGDLHYTITLSREGVGWRVTGLDYNWRSSGG